MNIKTELEIVKQLANERGDLLLKSHANGRLTPPSENDVKDNLTFMLCNTELDQAVKILCED